MYAQSVEWAGAWSITHDWRIATGHILAGSDRIPFWAGSDDVVSPHVNIYRVIDSFQLDGVIWCALFEAILRPQLRDGQTSYQEHLSPMPRCFNSD